MDSTHVTISISHLESQVEPKPPSKEEKKEPKALSFVHNIVSHTREKITSNKQDVRKLIHSAKVGIALVLVSLLYLLDPLYDQVGDNAMWAIMTVVVIFEFYAGNYYFLSTLNKILDGFWSIDIKGDFFFSFSVMSILFLSFAFVKRDSFSFGVMSTLFFSLFL